MTSVSLTVSCANYSTVNYCFMPQDFLSQRCYQNECNKLQTADYLLTSYNFQKISLKNEINPLDINPCFISQRYFLFNETEGRPITFNPGRKAN